MSHSQPRRRQVLQALLSLLGASLLPDCTGSEGSSSTSPAPSSSPTGASSTTQPPPSGGKVVELALSSSVGGKRLPWTVGHFFREGDVPTGMALAADVEDFQAVVRNRWPDGSIKYAVLSGQCDFTAGEVRTVALQRIGKVSETKALSLADLEAKAVNVSVRVGDFGTVQLATALATPHRQLLSGPVASEWQFRLPVDTQLTVWFYVRLYSGGRIEFMVSIENGWFDYAGAINKKARLVVTVDDQTAFDSLEPVDIKHHARIVCAKGHSGKLWIGGDPEVIPAHDAAYLQLTRAVPAYQTSTIQASLLDAQAQSYVPLAQHDLPGNDLGGGGDSPGIGWLPRWDAAYVVSADPRAYRTVLVDSLASGAWSYHRRDAATGNVVSYGAFPTVRLQADIGANESYGGRTFFSGQYGSDWDISHGWPPGYLAYLLTGDYWHLEELHFAVMWVHYMLNVTARGNEKGLMVSGLQTRGVAWAWRNCGLCATMLPDAEDERKNLIAALAASFAWMPTFHTNTLGYILEPDQYGWGDPEGSRPWMTDYVTGTLSWLIDLKLFSGQGLEDANRLMTWLGNGLVQRMSDGTNPKGWHWEYQTGSPPITSAAWPYYQKDLCPDWGQAFALAFQRPNGSDLDDGVLHEMNYGDPYNLPSWPVKKAFGANYFEYAMSALAMCVNRNVEGAATAFSRILASSNYEQCRQALSGDPRWGIAPRS
ncbi:MAG: hypothetical protein QM784_39280 [Polyangiaceae bacterium]